MYVTMLHCNIHTWIENKAAHGDDRPGPEFFSFWRPRLLVRQSKQLDKYKFYPPALQNTITLDPSAFVIFAMFLLL